MWYIIFALLWILGLIIVLSLCRSTKLRDKAWDEALEKYYEDIRQHKGEGYER